MSASETSSIDAAAAAERLRTLANPTRLRIALHLLDGERAVGEIEAALDLRQPGLSQQLAELRDAGLVTSRRDGKAVFYRLADAAQRRLIEGLVFGFGGALPVEVRPVPRRSMPLLGAVFATVGGVA